MSTELDLERFNLWDLAVEWGANRTRFARLGLGTPGFFYGTQATASRFLFSSYVLV
jgi:hypothetical protein